MLKQRTKKNWHTRDKKYNDLLLFCIQTWISKDGKTIERCYAAVTQHPSAFLQTTALLLFDFFDLETELIDKTSK